MSVESSLTGKVVVVTGAAQGIGKGIAQALAQRGASVLVADRNGDAVEATARELTEAGGSAAAVTADLLDDDAAQRIVAAAVEAFGGLDALVNNAVASCGAKPFVDQTDADFDLAFGTGPKATFRLMKEAHPHLVARGGGSIVNFGSGAGAGGMALFATYGGAKEAIRGLTKVAALEWGPQNIRVNTVCPAAATEGFTSWMAAEPETANAMIAQIPLQRIGDPAGDIGSVVAFLVGEDSSYMTGQTFFVDGGTGFAR